VELKCTTRVFPEIDRVDDLPFGTRLWTRKILDTDGVDVFELGLIVIVR
jgi:hypothetical protein